MEKLITLQQASDLLGVSKITLRRWETSGKLKALRTTGGARRYSEDDINKLLNMMRKNEETND